MSFELYLSAFKAGEPVEFPTAIIEETFLQFIRHREPRCWTLSFPDGGEPEIYVDDSPGVSGFIVSRPPPSLEFWSALLDVMRRTRAVCYWPGGESPVVADAAAAGELPNEMLESLGRPKTIADAASFRAEIER
jgi:hypothetical protein